LSSEPLCLTGDFNVHVDVPNDSAAESFRELGMQNEKEVKQRALESFEVTLKSCPLSLSEKSCDILDE